MSYAIHLHQSTGETQTQDTSDSKEQILIDWDYWKAQLDLYTEFDDELTLRQSTSGFESDDEMIDCYIIPNSQRGVDKMSFMVSYGDACHEEVIEKFNTLEEATACFNKQVAEAKNDIKNYFSYSDWDGDEPPYIAIESLDAEGNAYGEVEAWVATQSMDS